MKLIHGVGVPIRRVRSLVDFRPDGRLFPDLRRRLHRQRRVWISSRAAAERKRRGTRREGFAPISQACIRGRAGHESGRAILHKKGFYQFFRCSET